MNSSQFDAYLYLLDNSGTVLAQNDDSGGSLNSLIQMQLSPGTYYLGAAAFGGGLGAFELVSTGVPAGGCGFALSSARAATGKAP
jgi:hypothetical protein